VIAYVCTSYHLAAKPKSCEGIFGRIWREIVPLLKKQIGGGS